MGYTALVPPTKQVDPDSVFQDEDESAQVAETLFEDEGQQDPPASTVEGYKRPIAKAVLALATASPTAPPELALQEENLKRMEDLINSQQEFNKRLEVASQRQEDTAIFLNKIQADLAKSRNPIITPETKKIIDDAYNYTIEYNAQQNVFLESERNAIEKVQAAMAEGDYVEAALHMSLHDSGGLMGVRKDILTKQLIAAQFIEEMSAEYENSSNIRGFINGVLRFGGSLFLLENFAKSGIARDAGLEHDTSFFDFLLRGNNLEKQRSSIYDIPAEDFARLLGPGGELRKAIMDNAGEYVSDPYLQYHISKQLLEGMTPLEKVEENVWSAVDDTILIPFTGVTRLVKAAGSRRLASEIAASALQRGDAIDISRTVGDELLDVADEVVPGSTTVGRQGVPLGTDAIRAIQVSEEIIKDMPAIQTANKLSSIDELIAAVNARKVVLEKQYGTSVKDFTVMEHNVATGTLTDAPHIALGQLPGDGNRTYFFKVTAGKKDGTGGYASEASARRYIPNHLGVDADSMKFIQSDGQWYGQFLVNIPTEGFITAPLKSSTASRLFSFFTSAGQVGDIQAHSKALVGENGANLFSKAATQYLKTSMKGISRGDRTVLREILKKNNKEAKWYSTDDFALEYERMTGTSEIPKKVMEAYDGYRKLSDIAWYLRNRNIYLEKAHRGFESMKITYGDEIWDVDGKINYNPKQAPIDSVFDVDNGRFLSRDWLTGENLRKLADDGYVLVRMDQKKMIASGEEVVNVLVKRQNLETRPLRSMQLNYSAGGSRAYTAKYFAKQAMETTGGHLTNPHTWIAGLNKNELRRWATQMNQAIEHMRANYYDPDMVLLEDILSKAPGAPSPTEFVDLVHANKIGIKHNIEVVADKGYPSQYFERGKEYMRYLDEETTLEAYHRSHGNMYYSPKGEHLLDYTGQFAETVDPWEMLNRSLTEVTRNISFAGYKENLLERFKKTYGQFLEVGDLENESLYSLANAKVRSGLGDPAIERKIANEQEAIKRILNFETGFEKKTRLAVQNLADWVLGEGLEGSVREKGSKVVSWLGETNPVRFLRGWAFDLNLGFLNPNQLIIQASTMASAAAVYGSVKPFKMIAPMFAWRLGNYSDNLLDVLSKRGVWKGFLDSEEEFKSFMKYFRASGVDEVSGATFAGMNDYGINRVFGATSTVDAVREKGRMFFWSAERWNRSFAAAAAWETLKKKGVKFGSAEFQEGFLRLTDDYSFSMMNSSKASFQQGAWSIPTQFWGYTFRMLEGLLGKKFTPAQRLRLLSINALIGGTAGIPGGILLESMWEKYGNEGAPTSIDNWDGWLERGVLDGMAYVTTGADVRIGDKVGTMDLIPNAILDLFSIGEYGEKSTAEVLAGATGSKAGTMLPIFWDAAKYSTQALVGLDTWDLAEDDWLRFARELQTFNYGYNTYIAANYGYFKTKNGSIQEANLPDADAFFFALGFAPGSSDEISRYFKGLDDQDVRDMANTINKWRQEAMVNPDKLKENSNKERMLLGTLPMSDRIKVREKTRLYNAPLLDSIKRRFEEEYATANWQDSIANHTNQEREE